MQIIPALDLREGKCVRLVNGDFDAEMRYETTPEGLYDRFVALGANWLHVVDLDGARRGTQQQLPLISSLARRGLLKLQVGGGIRTRSAIDLTLAAGVDRVVLGSAAATNVALVDQCLRKFGPDAIMLALDVRVDWLGTPRLSTHGWATRSRLNMWEVVPWFLPAGLKHVLCTDISRDGALRGPNVALYTDAKLRFPTIAWQASGGIRDVQDLRALAESGVSAAVSGRSLLERRITDEELRPFLPAA